MAPFAHLQAKASPEISHENLTLERLDYKFGVDEYISFALKPPKGIMYHYIHFSMEHMMEVTCLMSTKTLATAPETGCTSLVSQLSVCPSALVFCIFCFVVFFFKLPF